MTSEDAQFCIGHPYRYNIPAQIYYIDFRDYVSVEYVAVRCSFTSVSTKIRLLYFQGCDKMAGDMAEITNGLRGRPAD